WSHWLAWMLVGLSIPRGTHVRRRFCGMHWVNLNRLGHSYRDPQFHWNFGQVAGFSANRSVFRPEFQLYLAIRLKSL
ncbi:MAG: hypothetical protein WAM25_19995, partial [Candidatus Acidiferrales bacterium]